MQRAPDLWMLRQPRSGSVAPSIGCWETGASLLRRRFSPDTVDEFSLLPEWYSSRAD